MKSKYVAFFAMGAALLLSSCAVAPATPSDVSDLPGFWAGLWHGIIIVWAFIGSLFSDNIAIYAVPNKGALYDFGFVIGIGAIGVLMRD